MATGSTDSLQRAQVKSFTLLFAIRRGGVDLGGDGRDRSHRGTGGHMHMQRQRPGKLPLVRETNKRVDVVVLQALEEVFGTPDGDGGAVGREDNPGMIWRSGEE